MRSFRIVAYGPVLASRLACHRDTTARCGRTIIAPSSSRSRPLTRRLRRWPSASLDRNSPRRQRSPPTNDALLTTYSPYKVQPKQPAFPCAMVYGLFRVLPVNRSRGTGLDSHRRECIIHPLDPSVETASGDRDHTPLPSVPRITRQLMPARPSHPAPRVVTIAIRPSGGREAG